MKIIIDMNLSPRWVEFLTGAGLKCSHWSALGEPAAPDTEIMAYAAQHACIVLTHDLDFSAILAATGAAKPSVVQIRAGDLSVEAIGAQIVTAMRQFHEELSSGALISVETARMRARVLPL